MTHRDSLGAECRPTTYRDSSLDDSGLSSACLYLADFLEVSTSSTELRFGSRTEATSRSEPSEDRARAGRLASVDSSATGTPERGVCARWSSRANRSRVSRVSTRRDAVPLILTVALLRRSASVGADTVRLTLTRMIFAGEPLQRSVYGLTYACRRRAPVQSHHRRCEAVNMPTS